MRLFRSLVAVAALFCSATSQAAVIDSVSGLQLWLRADAINALSDGDPVSTWVDSSSNLNNALGVGANRPSYQTNELGGLPVVRFDDDNGGANYDVLTFSTINLGTAHTLFFVDSTVKSTAILLGNTGANNYNNDAGQHTYNAGGSFVQAGTFTTGAFTLRTVSRNGTSVNFGENGSADGSAVLGVNNNIAFQYVGRRDSVPAFNYEGDFAEIVIFDSTLSLADQQLVEGSLAWKYGLQGLLPNDHPYFLINPNIEPPVVPEPSTVFLLGLGAVALACKARRRRS